MAVVLAAALTMGMAMVLPGQVGFLWMTKTAPPPPFVECQYRYDGQWLLPDSSPNCTPGAARTTEANKIVGTTTSQFRHVTEAEKKKACAEYGVSNCPSKAYEIDHLESLEVGGSNDIHNLWPQPIEQARIKDKLENLLGRRVKAGTITPADAQSCLARDWYACYRKYASEIY